jgi:5-(carboxyamino)imidazole ribonucleotide synthase
VAVIGVLGGGQLGRFLALDAQAWGHSVVVRTDEPAGGPAGQVAHGEIIGAYDDTRANRDFAARCDVVTAEFENLPGSLLAEIADLVPIFPSVSAIVTCQHRRREKEFLRAYGIPHAAFHVVDSASSLQRAVDDFGGNAVLKTAAFGYDGKGQVRFQDALHGRVDEALSETSRFAQHAWDSLGAKEAVLERFVPFEAELSVVGARGRDGSWVSFPAGRNVHRNGILDYTVAPGGFDVAVEAAADQLAHTVAEALGYVGVLGVECFVLPGGSLVVNEAAQLRSPHHRLVFRQPVRFAVARCAWRTATGANNHFPVGDAQPARRVMDRW